MKAIAKTILGGSSVNVKIRSKFFERSAKKWYANCKVTSENNKFYRLGENVQISFDNLFLKESIDKDSPETVYLEGKPNFDKIPFWRATMNDTYKTEIVEQHGKSYLVEYLYDYSSEAPWIKDDWHGDVDLRKNAKNKRPGERVLLDGRNCRYSYFYDFQSACKKARKEWGCATRKEAAEAAEKDFKYLQDWLNNKWFYIGIVVTKGEEVDGEFIKDETLFDSLWGIDSEVDISSYILDMIGNIESFSNEIGEQK